jgi:putative transposase
MRSVGLRGATRATKRFTTRSDPSHTSAPDLAKREFRADRPDRLWVADFTYCSTWSGIVYVAFVVDVFARRIVGWKAARNMYTSIVLDALSMAAWIQQSPWRNQPSGCSRLSCTATPPPWPPTEDLGGDSTTSR